MTVNKKTIELLSPARDAECGIEAIRHGADAVYIGGPSFGARAAASNTVEEISRLCDYAHLFGARVYVTLNTILYDEELEKAERLAWILWDIGADALIVQDMALLMLNLPPIALHASTQMDTRTPEKAKWIEAAGFSQIVVARETQLRKIHEISKAVSAPIEAFVHGALCTSYSGICYASQYCFGRSANRGRCAQFCRLAFDLVDGNGHELAHGCHLLSLRDMSRMSFLEEMMDAGVRSFKIEGRLKDTSYVKNVTAHYRQEIDKIIARRREDYVRSSYGKSIIGFQPNASRSFNRCFTDYFLHGRDKKPISSPYTPKAVGPVVGKVKRVAQHSLSVEPSMGLSAPLSAGDGLCYVDKEGTLRGFRINKVGNGHIFPATMPHLTTGAVLHRSLDYAMERMLSKPTAKRKLSAKMTLREIPFGYAIDMSDESGCHVSLSFEQPHEPAHSPQQTAIERLLKKTGETCFTVREVTIETKEPRFIPASVLTDWRRAVCASLERCHRMSHNRETRGKANKEKLKEYTPKIVTFNANVANKISKLFYENCGAKEIFPAFELQQPKGETVIMTCKHCIRHDLGICLRLTHDNSEPLYLRMQDGRTFPLKFDCRRCEMLVMKN